MAVHGGPARDLRELNAQMVRRILGGPQQQLADGLLALRVLEVAGRTSGRPRRTPVGVLRTGVRRYLVSPDPERDWVRNLRAAGHCVLAGPAEAVAYRAELAGGEEAARAVVRYLSQVEAPWALAAFPVAADASAEEIRDHLDSLAVFRLEAHASPDGPV